MYVKVLHLNFVFRGVVFLFGFRMGCLRGLFGKALYRILWITHVGILHVLGYRLLVCYICLQSVYGLRFRE